MEIVWMVEATELWTSDTTTFCCGVFSGLDKVKEAVEKYYNENAGKLERYEWGVSQDKIKWAEFSVNGDVLFVANSWLLDAPI
tara:strand:+ start:296 stop:544 length:249 start_codon:yes stop_codon:yes gene_type:complete